MVKTSNLIVDTNQQQAFQGHHQQSGYPPQQQQAYYPPSQQQPYNPQQTINMQQQAPYMDPEDPDAKGFEFNEQSIRKAFIRKVFSILTVSK